jgi:hypothetical protein
MYRLLEEADEIRERRDLLRHPTYKKPELLAENPNQVRSWDITKLPGPAKCTYNNPYVIIEIFRPLRCRLASCREGKRRLGDWRPSRTLAPSGGDSTPGTTRNPPTPGLHS